MSGHPKVSARTEAQPFPWGALSADQRGAASQVCNLIASMTAQADEVDRRAERDELQRRSGRSERRLDFLPRIDAHRESRTILIDGKRGTGKTVVLLTLLEAWARRARGGSDPDGTPDELKKLLDQTASVLPIGLIDLEALPADTNLLVQLVGHFQRVVRALEPNAARRGDERRSGERHAPPPWEGPQDEPAARRAWLQFLRAAALGGSEGELARRSHLDAESLVVELEETELQRMDIARSFAELVNALSREAAAQKLLVEDGQAPMFVLAVDDADMQPELCVRLLRLVRQLCHHRLVFLMTGESELFLKRLLEEGLSHVPEALSTFREDRTLVVHRELAEQRYRKIVPPAQRCNLKVLLPRERAERVRAALVRVAAPEHPLKLRNMADYFDMVKQCAELLPANFRELTDLQQWIDPPSSSALSSHQVSVQPSPAEPMSAERFVWAITIRPQDYNDVRPTYLSFLLSQLRNQLYQIRGDLVRWIPRDGFIPIAFSSADSTHQGVIEACQTGYLEAWSERTEASYGLSTHWLIEAETLAHRDDGDVALKLPAVVRTRRGNHSYGWPTPQWNSPLDLAALGTITSWMDNQASDLPPPTRGQFARRYLAAVLDYIEIRQRRSSAGSDVSVAPLADEIQSLAVRTRAADPSWQSSAVRVSELILADSAKDPAVHDWAVCAGLLASPEIDLGASEGNDWLRALRAALGRDWKWVRDELHRKYVLMRRESAPPGRGVDSSTGVEDFVPSTPEVDERGEYEWDLRVGQETTVSRFDAWKAFLAKAAEFPVSVVEPHIGPLPRDLRRYFPDPISSYIEDNVAPELVVKWTKALELVGGGHDSAVIALRDLWIATRQIVPEMPQIPDELSPAKLLALYEEAAKSESIWRYVPQASGLKAAPSVVAYRGSFGWGQKGILKAPLANVMFQIAWDVVFESADKQELPDWPATLDTSLRWWLGGGGSGGPDILYPWPAVNWWSFADHTAVASAWDTHVKRMLSWSPRELESERLGDDLALWYVRLIEKVAEERNTKQTSIPWVLGTSRRDWMTQIQSMLGHRPAHHVSARWRCYEEWLDRLPLLAAPESGLSPVAARWILDAFDIKTVSQERIKQLQQERRNRLVEGLGYTKVHARHQLAAIDAKAGDHPWLKHFSRAARG